MRPESPGSFNQPSDMSSTRKAPERGPLSETSLTPTVKRLEGQITPSRPLAVHPPAAPSPVPVATPAPASPPDLAAQRVFRIIELPVPPEALLPVYDTNTAHAVPTILAVPQANGSWRIFLWLGLAILVLVTIGVGIALLRR